MEARISTHLIVDYAEFLTWLVRQKIVITDQVDGSEITVDVEPWSRASIEGIPPDHHALEDWHYMLRVNGVVRTQTRDDPYPEIVYWALEISPTARADDGWRPYYHPRKPSWDPMHGLPVPRFRAASGRFTVYDEKPYVWDLMVKNPWEDLPSDRVTMDAREWVAISEFLRWLKSPANEEHLLSEDSHELWVGVRPGDPGTRYLWDMAATPSRGYQPNYIARNGIPFYF